MNRRAFLTALTTGLAATAVLATVDPEALLWKPGAKSLILPPDGGWSPRVGDTIRVRKPARFQVTDGGGMLKPGDIFTIEGIYVVNPITRKEELQRFIAQPQVIEALDGR